MAKIILKTAKQPISNENIGEIIHYIMLADSKYNPNIGSKFGFRKMYIKFALCEINKNKTKYKNTVLIDDFSTVFCQKLCYKDFNLNIFKNFLKNKLTKIEYNTIINRHVMSKTLKEISDELNCSPQWVTQILKRSYKKLREYYE